MCLLRRFTAHLYPNMTHFDVVDFRECQFGEVLSVFLNAQFILYNSYDLLSRGRFMITLHVCHNFLI